MKHEKRVALVVGNGGYENTGWLPNPPNDAAAIASSLKRLDFEVLDGGNLNYADFAGRIRDFGRALKEAHVALFFYAGHGLQVKGENYVVPIDAALEHEADVQLELIGVQTILAQMEVGNRTSLVILDACRDNPLARNLARSIGTSRSAVVGEGLGRLESGIGTFIAFATSPNKVALDGDIAGNSPFTAALIRHIETPGLTITDVMMRVRQDVIEATKRMRQGPQVPWDNSSLVAPFYFKRTVSSSAQSPAPPDPAIITDRAERDWDRFEIATTEHVPTIEAYIAQYEVGERLWAARARQRLEVVQALNAAREAARREVDVHSVQLRFEPGRPGERGELWEVAEEKAEDAEKRAKGIVKVEAWTPYGLKTRWIAPGSGQDFKDFAEGPEMVIVPSGEFMMGAPDSEEGRSADEGPRHRVIIPQPFAIGRYAVTRGQFSAFVNATGHKTDGGAHVWTGREWKLDPAKSWRDPGFQQDDQHPVVGVSWHDATAYAVWLSKQTGKRYLLPSEAEWEYAARAGTQTPFWWGSSITPEQANYDGNYTFGGGPKGEYRQKTVPVRSFEANPWGLYQVHGNVWEWVEDGWHDSYAGKPETIKADGGVWTAPDGSARVLRGGSWGGNPRGLRSAYRLGNAPGSRYVNFGFRVARTLSPL